jgi:hypothetical protein
MIVIAIAAVVAIGALFVFSGGDDLSKPPAPRTATEQK